MFENIKVILMYIGAMCILCFLSLCIIFLKEFITDCIESIKWKYEYEHRFDEPPLAKCYCKDCEYYNEQDKRCISLNGWCVADNSFCWRAEPKKHTRKRKQN